MKNIYYKNIVNLYKTILNSFIYFYWLGINCLPKDIDKYILLGNHEYDSMIDESEQNIQCISLIKQKEEFAKEKSIFFNDIIHHVYNNTLIIMLDTTIYEFLQDKNESTPSQLCYDKVFIDKPFTNLIDIAQYQEEEIKKIIIKYNHCNNIIFIGHHPIFTVKQKKDKNKQEILFGLVQLYQNIKDIVRGKNIYHLCADTHLYQTGIVNIDDININQYVVGTGGAEQDNCPPIGPYEKSNIKYNITECVKNFGFLVVDIDDLPSFNFISIDTTLSGGYYFKYMKYKNKYYELKNKIENKN
jgi:hypothetical protein